LVGLGGDFSRFGGLGWVRSFVLACRSTAEDILNISLKSLFLNDVMKVFYMYDGQLRT